MFYKTLSSLLQPLEAGNTLPHKLKWFIYNSLSFDVCPHADFSVQVLVVGSFEIRPLILPFSFCRQ